jgi:hypothetical protein
LKDLVAEKGSVFRNDHFLAFKTFHLLNAGIAAFQSWIISKYVLYGVLQILKQQNVG